MLCKGFARTSPKSEYFGPLMLQNLWVCYCFQSKIKESLFWKLWCSKTNGSSRCCKKLIGESMFWDLRCPETNSFWNVLQRKNKRVKVFYTSDAPKVWFFKVLRKKKNRLNVFRPLMFKNHAFSLISKKQQQNKSMFLELWCCRTNGFQMFCMNKTKASLFWKLWCSKCFDFLSCCMIKAKESIWLHWKQTENAPNATKTNRMLREPTECWENGPRPNAAKTNQMPNRMSAKQIWCPEKKTIAGKRTEC